ncbi:MAG: hypothetical protein IID40_11050 [Planctomycetes bacterium]|nr:hypothetical protein [Planctomycetota bacterium]
MKSFVPCLGMALLAQVALAQSHSPAPGDRTLGFSLADAFRQTDPGSGGSSDAASSSAGVDLLWPGFMTGLSGFEGFVKPVGMPIYFEDPFITNDLNLFYVYHKVPSGSQIRGGEIQVWGAQIRLALSERWQFLATKDGYSKVDTGVVDSDGWNDLTAGLKYALHVDQANQFLVSTGLKWELSNGKASDLQDGGSELNPFVSVAKAWDKWHFIGALNGRIPMNPGNGTASIVWNLHLDYELYPDFRPLIEVHGIHWLSNGDTLPIKEDYLDVGSVGSNGVSGRDFFALGLGFRWQIMDNVSWGSIFEIPLESQSQNPQQYRFTTSVVVSF